MPYKECNKESMVHPWRHHGEFRMSVTTGNLMGRCSASTEKNQTVSKVMVCFQCGSTFAHLAYHSLVRSLVLPELLRMLYQPLPRLVQQQTRLLGGNLRHIDAREGLC